MKIKKILENGTKLKIPSKIKPPLTNENKCLNFYTYDIFFFLQIFLMLGLLSNAIVGAIDVSKSEDAIKIDAQTATLVSSLLRNSAERYGNTGCGVFM